LSTNDAPWPPGYDRIILDEVDSTNAEAIRRAPSLTKPTWIMAKSQSSARGRRGRTWENPTGNFAATLLLKPDMPPAQAALYSYVMSLAAYMALWGEVGHGIYKLKWPNDVLLNDGKVAGILLEASGAGTDLDWLAIGIGVNLLSAPSACEVEMGAVRPVSVLQETRQILPPEELLLWLAVHFDIYAKLMSERGFDPIRRLWLKQAAKLGEQITAKTGTTVTQGVFETLDPDGHLVLRTPAGLQTIAAADVYF
jgi:BirA family biotin operon repressor/biotin-[acetyl-CoA-carboxylase] ligase